jgi:radical SAM superfamily enzyme YgiQ (UPF0313 family)
MSVKISFADLTHTGQLVAANTAPLGIGMVASYAKNVLKDEIDIEIFKYPDDFSSYLDTAIPQIACFSSFSWNVALGNEYAKKIKEASPETITVFGGPNFPDAPEEQREFLNKFSGIDCYLEFEGELSFVELFSTLKSLDFDWERFKRERPNVPNIRYLVDGEIVTCALGPKIKDVNALPSPYTSGLMDKFFDEVLIPLMQTTRGCPFTCAFCWEGGEYFRKTTRFSEERIEMDLHYIAERVKSTDLCIVDANFGMFKEDINTAKEVLKMQKKYNWPKTVLAATAKNHKERTIEIVEMLGDTLPPTAAVQSTNDDVLEKIRRKNVSQEALIALAKTVERVGGQSEAELILGLEGDTKERHFKTVSDMLVADMTFIRMYQFMMLPGTQSASKVSREKYSFKTRFRVLPRCFGTYKFRGEVFPVAEIEEICVASNSMSHEDYHDCRDLHLTVEVFNNDSILADLMQILRQRGIDRSTLIEEIHQRALNHDELGTIYTDFREEEKTNLSENREELEEFSRKPGVIEQYISGEYGTNELYKYRVIAVFDKIKLVHEIAYGVARDLLDQLGKMDEQVDNYLSELYEFSLIRKSDPINTQVSETRVFHYDFVQLMNGHFLDNPFDYYEADGIEMAIYHSDKQVDLIDGYAKQYGTDQIGLGRIVLRANMNRLYRTIRRLDIGDEADSGEGQRESKRSKLKLIA